MCLLSPLLSPFSLMISSHFLLESQPIQPHERGRDVWHLHLIKTVACEVPDEQSVPRMISDVRHRAESRPQCHYWQQKNCGCFGRSTQLLFQRRCFDYLMNQPIPFSQ